MENYSFNDLVIIRFAPDIRQHDARGYAGEFKFIRNCHSATPCHRHVFAAICPLNHLEEP